MEFFKSVIQIPDLPDVSNVLDVSMHTESIQTPSSLHILLCCKLLLNFLDLLSLTHKDKVRIFIKIKY